MKVFMLCIISVAALPLWFTQFADAQTPAIKPGATVYIESTDGYETYLAAAIAKKQVPLVVVTDRAKADYVISSTVNQHSPSQPAFVVNNTTNVSNNGNDAFSNGWKLGAGRPGSQGSTSASISVVDVHSSQIVFAYAAGKNANHQLQSTAEACAKHLKEFIVKPRR